MTGKTRAGALAEQLKDTSELVKQGVMPPEMSKQGGRREDAQSSEQKERLRTAKAKLQQFWED